MADSSCRLLAILSESSADEFFNSFSASALDLRHQLDTLKYMQEIIKKKDSCMIIALHDLNLAIRYSDKVVALKDGKVYDFGKTEDVITEKMISDVYGVESEIVETSRGKYVHAFDSEIDEMQLERMRSA